MSNYKDFSRCVVCRSQKNLEDYHGDFEVTMLLNTLYMTVMYSVEKRKELHIKIKQIVQYLEKQELVDKCNNDYNPDNVIRYLRNGLAHFNIVVTSGDVPKGQIKDIKIWAKNLENKPRCLNPCENRQCLPPQYHEKDGAICIFNFTIKSLREFTDFIINTVLNTLDDGMCVDCPYRKDK